MSPNFFRALPPRSTLLPLIAWLAFATCCGAADSNTNHTGVKITEEPGKLRVEINGKLFTEYYFKDVPRPFFYPLIGPGDLPMTRNFPMHPDSPDEEHDHPHHRSLWYAHGSVNGHDFWSEQKDFGKIVHEKFTEIKSGRDSGVIQSQDKWVAHDGTVVCTDERVLRIYNPAAGRVFDFEITLHASHSEVTFGDTKEGTMAVRLAETMRLKQPKGKPGDGHIVSSTGVRDDATWGKRADWVDYYGPVGGKTVGIAIFDYPQNPRHPTWWHVRDYGLFAANPFGVHDFEKKEKDAGSFIIPAGQSVTFRYRFYLHEGDEQQAGVAAHYADYVRSTSSKSK